MNSKNTRVSFGEAKWCGGGGGENRDHPYSGPKMRNETVSENHDYPFSVPPKMRNETVGASTHQAQSPFLSAFRNTTGSTTSTTVAAAKPWNYSGGGKSSKNFAESLVLQGHLKDVKDWSKYKCDKLDILFDIHAMIDSSFSTNQYDGVSFVLRDSTDSLPVTYYEIDTEFPLNVSRGDWVRVGGTPRPWGFQATSIQKAPQGFLNGFYDKLLGSKMALERKVRELNL